MSAGLDLLFDEFAASYARGEHPDPRDYLDRAGERRDELAHLLDGFLAAAPVQPPTEETVALLDALVSVGARLASPSPADTPPLLAERVRRGWRRDEIVDWIRERFGIAEEKREKVARYWHELETGLLPASGISERLREALFERFGDALQAAVAWEPPGLDADLSYLRVQDAPALMEASFEPLATPPASAAEPDDVDVLFLGAGES